jgi:hypothetical protein
VKTEDFETGTAPLTPEMKRIAEAVIALAKDPSHRFALMQVAEDGDPVDLGCAILDYKAYVPAEDVAPLLAALLSTVEEAGRLAKRVEFLEKVAEQALSGGVAPSLPRPLDIEDFLIFADSPEEAEEDMARRTKDLIPFGEDTVNFFGSDECDHPYNCPELAAYLREHTQGDAK